MVPDNWQREGASPPTITRREAFQRGRVVVATFAFVPALQACGGDEPEETATAPPGEEAPTRPVTTLEPMEATPAESTPWATPAGATPEGGAPQAATPEGETTEGETHLVEMNDDLDFVPEQLTLQVGDTVVWRTVGAVPHTATCDPDLAENPEEHVQLPEGAEPWDSGTVGEGEEYERVFDVPGEYIYFCIPHEANGMIGYLTVEE